MPEITFIHKDAQSETIQAEPNWSIMQVGVEHNVKGIEGVCGGSMACATCHIYIHPDWVERVRAEDNEQSEEETDMLDMALDVCETSRLGCQIQLTEKLDGLIVGLPGASF